MSVPTQPGTESTSSTTAAASNPAPNTNATVATAAAESTAPAEAAAKLAEALDDFLNHVEKKFKTVSDEILTKLDDMAERCDRLEQEMMTREAIPIESQVKGADEIAQAETPA